MRLESCSVFVRHVLPEGWRKFHIEELHYFHSSDTLKGKVKRARRVRDERDENYIRRKLERKGSLKRYRHRCKDNITTYDEEMKWETVD